MADEANFDDIAQQLADELGLEALGSEPMSEVEEEFFAKAASLEGDESPDKEPPAADAAEPEGEEPSTEQTEKFVYDHNGIHREFNTREELLSFENGVKSNEIGDLRKQLTELRELVTQSKDAPPQMDQKQIDQSLLRIAFPDLPEDALQDPAYRTIVKGMERMITAYHENVASKQLSTVESSVAEMRKQAAESAAIAQAGVDPGFYRSTLEKYPSLSQLPAEERVAMIKDMARKDTGAKPANPVRRALQPSAADHVEGSVSSLPPQDYETSLEQEIDKMGDKDALKVFGRLFDQSEFGNRIKQDQLGG